MIVLLLTTILPGERHFVADGTYVRVGLLADVGQKGGAVFAWEIAGARSAFL